MSESSPCPEIRETLREEYLELTRRQTGSTSWTEEEKKIEKNY
jgi:hypothetical protein